MLTLEGANTCSWTARREDIVVWQRRKHRRKWMEDWQGHGAVGFREAGEARSWISLLGVNYSESGFYPDVEVQVEVYAVTFESDTHLCHFYQHNDLNESPHTSRLVKALIMTTTMIQHSISNEDESETMYNSKRRSITLESSTTSWVTFSLRDVTWPLDTIRC